MKDSTNNTPPLALSPDAHYEAVSYYWGLPSTPFMVYRTGAPWKRPTGPEAYRVPKEARPVVNHPITNIWDELGPQVLDYLDSIDVMWTTIDVVRFAEDDEKPGPPVLWIGVKPGSLSREDAKVATVGCEGLLQSFELTDVEVGFRESLFTRLAGPKLQGYPYFIDPTAEVRNLLTPALGLRIAPRATPYAEGTGALYLRESNDSSKVYVLTARHVVFPPDVEPNELYAHRDVSQPRRDVILFGRKTFQNLLESTTSMIAHYSRIVGPLACNQGMVKDDKSDITQARHPPWEVELLNEFYTTITKHWSIEDQRVLGHIVYSPPISISTSNSAKRFTEDWALIELDSDKIDWKTFEGNAIPLGMKKSLNFNLKIRRSGTAPDSFRLPVDFLRLQAILKDDELRYPMKLEQCDEPCPFVIKNGARTGATIGRASSLMSFVREYLPNGDRKTSKELAIFGQQWEGGAFSAPGDSGSIIADPMGRIVGLLTGGCGKPEKDSIDVTYATPFYWLMERVKTRFPDACLY